MIAFPDVVNYIIADYTGFYVVCRPALTNRRGRSDFPELFTGSLVWYAGDESVYAMDWETGSIHRQTCPCKWQHQSNLLMDAKGRVYMLHKRRRNLRILDADAFGGRQSELSVRYYKDTTSIKIYDLDILLENNVCDDLEIHFKTPTPTEPSRWRCVIDEGKDYSHRDNRWKLNIVDTQTKQCIWSTEGRGFLYKNPLWSADSNSFIFCVGSIIEQHIQQGWFAHFYRVDIRNQWLDACR